MMNAVLTLIVKRKRFLVDNPRPDNRLGNIMDVVVFKTIGISFRQLFLRTTKENIKHILLNLLPDDTSPQLILSSSQNSQPFLTLHSLFQTLLFLSFHCFRFIWC
ncbi:hypothetical protein RB195_019449 [Necator americanus]|uniref:Uncharacterized protein n=1 Tax=Necator americanus TaxID=51031 RepID=A0ABR1CE82_NECAM